MPFGSDPIDGRQIVLDFSDDELGDLSAADLAHRYLWGAKVDELLADETVDDGSSDDVGWTFGDHQGSVRAVARYDSATNATAVTKTIVYDAYGNVASTSGTDTTTPLFLYTGRLYDSATQLQNNLNRWYDAAIGRWLSTDPIGFASDPGNLYRYCGNGPVNWIDPWGLDFDLLDWSANVAAGFGDTITFGLTDRIRDSAGINHGIDHSGGSYFTGVLVGMAFSITVSWIDPCALGNVAGTGLRVLNGLQAAGNIANAADHANEGDYGAAILDTVGQ